MLLLQEPPPLFIDKSLSGDMAGSDVYPLPRSSFHSNRKPSYDVRSLGSDGRSSRYFRFTVFARERRLSPGRTSADKHKGSFAWLAGSSSGAALTRHNSYDFFFSIRIPAWRRCCRIITGRLKRRFPPGRQ